MKEVKEAVFDCHSELLLESGEKLPGFQLRYATWGRLNAARDNVIWACHALTGNHELHLWWPGLFGPGKVYDPDTHFIICANALGGCSGSTGALSENPLTGKPYYHDFPDISNRDIVKAFDLLRKELGIEHVHTLIGGSLGGQHALEWAVFQPGVFRHLVLLATNAQHSPWGIAFNESQRMAIENDPTWKENSPQAGLQGMKAARAIAMLSYRHYRTYAQTQSEEDTEKREGFRASSYQRYQGEKLARRFSAFSYWHLSRAMDSHNLARNRGSMVLALAEVKAKTLAIGIDTDILFPPSEQAFVASLVPDASFRVVPSDYGHDGFLVETDRISALLESFYTDGRQRALVPEDHSEPLTSSGSVLG